MNINRKCVRKEGEVTVNTTYKDTVFCMLYHDKKNLLELYNGLNGTYYTDVNLLEVVTLKNAIYMALKNDVSFVLDSRMHLYEHQSTYNPNMPLRDLFYVSSEYQKLVKDVSMYSSSRVRIPAPRFIVFYNGTEERPEKEVLRLSDLYEMPEKEPMLELQVTVLNINAGKNQVLKEKCKSLYDYMVYVDCIRKYLSDGLSLQEAVEQSVDECISNNILADFLRTNKAEAIKVSIFEYDAEREIRLFREAEYRKAREEVREEVIEEVRQEVIEEVRQEVKEEVREEVKEEVRQEAKQEGIEEGIKALVTGYMEEGTTETDIVQKLMKFFHLSVEQAKKYYEMYSVL